MNIDLIKKDLISLGAKANLKGLAYTAFAIALYHDGCKVTSDKGIYGIIAKENNDAQTRVERAIRHMIEELYERVGAETLKNKFNEMYGLQVGWDFKPTNTEFIAAVKLGTDLKHGGQ